VQAACGENHEALLFHHRRIDRIGGCCIECCCAIAQQHACTASGVVAKYQVGQTIPIEMFADENVVKSYRHYHLLKPPKGYAWVLAGGSEILLVSMQSLIVSRVEFLPNVRRESN
jgi:Ni/Co efflux regulator RcnB